MTATAPATHPEFEELLVFLRDMRSFDFSGYKRTTVQRRVDKRMQTVGVQGHSAYRDYLEVHPGEFEALFNTILINVTSFFRDEAARAALRDDFVPALLDRKQGGQPIRVWSAGCATGQEAYTLVMLLVEALGIDAQLVVGPGGDLLLANEAARKLLEEVQRRSEALEQSNVYLPSVLASFRAGVAGQDARGAVIVVEERPAQDG